MGSNFVAVIWTSSVQIASIKTFYPEVYLGLGVLGHFGIKNKAVKIVKINHD